MISIILTPHIRRYDYFSEFDSDAVEVPDQPYLTELLTPGPVSFPCSVAMVLAFGTALYFNLEDRMTQLRESIYWTVGENSETIDDWVSANVPEYIRQQFPIPEDRVEQFRLGIRAHYTRLDSENAIQSGNMRLIQSVDIWRLTACEYAARHGQLEVLKWARSINCPWDADTCSNAARGGHIELLKWARANGCPWDEWTFAGAAEAGEFEVMTWLLESGCPWNAWVCQRAAYGGRLDVLEWLRERGCPWNAWVCSDAAAQGHLDVLKWLRDNGCPWDVWTIRQAQFHRHPDIEAWAVANGCPVISDDGL